MDGVERGLMTDEMKSKHWTSPGRPNVYDDKVAWRRWIRGINALMGLNQPSVR